MVDDHAGALGVEEGLGVADVLDEIGGHLLERFEDSGEDLLVGADDGIIGIGDEELHGAVVGVGYDLHGVADVVEGAGGAGEALRIGIHVGGGVGVLNPVEAAVLGGDDVGVGVVGEEGRDFAGSLSDVASPHDAAVLGDGRRDDHIDVFEEDGDGEARQPGADGNAALALIADLRHPVAGGKRVVVLLLRGSQDDVVVGQLAVVDGRLGYVEVVG